MAILAKNVNTEDDFDIDFGTNDLDLEITDLDEQPIEEDKPSAEESDTIIEDISDVPIIEEESKETEQPKVIDKKKAKEEAKAAKKNKKQISSSNSNESDLDENGRSRTLPNYILYIITDRNHSGMLNYFRFYGSKVTKVFDNLNEAKDILLMQIEPCKIVVIDSGTGKFTGMSARKSLMDLLSISDDDNRITIFYTDSVIKSEAKNTEGVEDKDITWHPYKNMAGVLALLLQNLRKENYVYEIFENEEVDKSEEVLKFQGATAKVKNETDLGAPILSIGEIIAHEGSNIPESESLERYKIKV